MPRKKKQKTFQQLWEEFEAAQRALFEYFESTVSKGETEEAPEEAEEESSEEESEEADAEETESEETEAEVEFPSAKEVAKLKKPKLKELAKQINLDIDGLDEADVRALLTTVSKVAEGDTDEIEDDEAATLCKALSLTPKKKLAQNIEQLQKYFSEEESETEETDTEESDGEESDGEEADAEDGEADSENGDGEESTEDDIDREEIAKSADLPDMATMKEQLEAYNEAAEEDDQIEVETGKTKAAYRKLIEKMIDSGGDIAEWGEPYVRNGEVCCCGLGLEEYEAKGEKGNFGKCVVTGKIFKVDDDGDATEYKPKKAKK